MKLYVVGVNDLGFVKYFDMKGRKHYFDILVCV